MEREEARQFKGALGRYEGRSAFEIWLWENTGYDTSCWDEEASDHHGSWCTAVGRHVLYADSQGFRHVLSYRKREGRDIAKTVVQNQAILWR